MSPTADPRPVGDLPDAIGRTAARQLQSLGITTLEQVAALSPRRLGSIHGVGPKAIAVLAEALATRGLAFVDEP